MINTQREENMFFLSKVTYFRTKGNSCERKVALPKKITNNKTVTELHSKGINLKP